MIDHVYIMTKWNLESNFRFGIKLNSLRNRKKIALISVSGLKSLNLMACGDIIDLRIMWDYGCLNS